VTVHVNKKKKKACGAVPFVAKQISMGCGRRYKTGFARHNPCLMRNKFYSSFHVLGKAQQVYKPQTCPHTKCREIRNETKSVRCSGFNFEHAITKWLVPERKIPRPIQKYKAYLKYVRRIRRGHLQSEYLRGQYHSSFINLVQSIKM
jgi:hypothetical protein